MVFSREKSRTDTLLAAKIVYDEKIIGETFKDSKPEDYESLIWNDIKEINENLPTFKHIKHIIITTEPMSKTTTQKIKRYEEIKKCK